MNTGLSLKVCLLTQCVSNFCVRQNYQKALLKDRPWALLPDYSDLLGPWLGPEASISNKFPGGADAAHLGTTF